MGGNFVYMPTPVVTAEDEVITKLTKTSAKAERMLSERDKLIVRAYAMGVSLRRIGNAVGMTHVGIKKLVDRHQADVVFVNEDGDICSVVEFKQITTDPEAAEAVIRKWDVIYRVDFEETIDQQ